MRCLGELFPGTFACLRDLFSILPEPTLRAAETELLAVLNAAAQPLDLDALLARTAAFCNEGVAFPRAKVVARLLERCPAVATTRDRRYFTYECGAARWLADVLREAGRPLRYGPLARAFNAGLQPACHRGRGFLVELVHRRPGFQTDARGVIRGSREPVYQPPNPPQYTGSGWTPEILPPAQAPGDSGGGNVLPLAQVSDGLLDLNTATQAQLESLPGIGPVFASRIIEYRTRTPFRSVDDLKNIKGIGDKRLADIRHLVTVR